MREVKGRRAPGGHLAAFDGLRVFNDDKRGAGAGGGLHGVAPPLSGEAGRERAGGAAGGGASLSACFAWGPRPRRKTPPASASDGRAGFVLLCCICSGTGQGLGSLQLASCVAASFVFVYFFCRPSSAGLALRWFFFQFVVIYVVSCFRSWCLGVDVIAARCDHAPGTFGQRNT